MRLPGTVKWIGLALLGLAIAGGVAFAASRLASQQIGIASESISAGDTLAPSGLVGHGKGQGGSGQPEKTPTTTPETGEGSAEEPAETVPTTPLEPPTTPESPTEHTEEDHSGGGGGGGGGADD